MQSLIDESQDNEWLVLLKSKWQHYSNELAPHGFLCDEFAKQTILCYSRGWETLKDVYLETVAVKAESPSRTAVPTLLVDYPEDPAWRQLTGIGLRISPDLHFYVTILESVQKEASSKPIFDDIKRLYTKISERFAEDRDFVK
jgi:hypothetical protein